MINGIGMRFVQIQPGQFVMGHPSQYVPNAQPPHRVTLTQPFLLGMYAG